LSFALALALSTASGAVRAASDPPTETAPSANAIQTVAYPLLSNDSAHLEPFAWTGPRTSLHADDARRWRAVARGIVADRAILSRCRIDPDTCPPAAVRLAHIVETARTKDGRARIGEVNRAINLAIAYTRDLVQHGSADVWSAPLQTFASGRGDCEDFAIAKHLALIELGVSRQDLRLVIVEAKRWRGQHAVLAIRLEGRWSVLDNTHAVMVEDRELAGYRVVAAFPGDDEPAPPTGAATLTAGAPAADPIAAGDEGDKADLS
jgi:predicted transglutaminase-like cysteine proteinase